MNANIKEVCFGNFFLFHALPLKIFFLQFSLSKYKLFFFLIKIYVMKRIKEDYKYSKCKSTLWMDSMVSVLIGGRVVGYLKIFESM